ncbi:MAG: thiamine phosphate synthase [Defluviitaleaceae bacterium]|nr:thiamine phosphate synthase [Defluviitaleaceae bacterium]
MNFKNQLYVITDGKPQLLERVAEALRGGATCIQYREKTKPIAEMVEEATLLKQLCHKYHVPLFINDHLDVAKAVNADGLHLGQSDSTVEEARELLGDIPIGISACTVNEARLAEEKGAVYVGVGAVFPTASKKDATLVSLETAKAIKASIKIPMLLIGGISLETAQLINIPYDGLCVISAILSADQPKEVAEAMRHLIDNHTH